MIKLEDSLKVGVFGVLLAWFSASILYINKYVSIFYLNRLIYYFFMTMLFVSLVIGFVSFVMHLIRIIKKIIDNL